MIKSIIHAGGESTRLKEIFNGPKALAPVGDHTLLWYHLQPLIKSKMISEYIFTLRHQHEVVQSYIDGLEDKFNISTRSIVEPSPLGRAGVVKLGIDSGIIDLESSYLMSHPDDLIPIDLKELVDYSEVAEKKGKLVVMVMAKNAVNPFGIGVAESKGGILELRHFKEKPELPFIENHYANTGMFLFLPKAMKEFKDLPLDKLTHVEHEIMPRLTSENKVAVFLVDRRISVNYSSDYKDVVRMGPEKLMKFLRI
ncbi:MAG: sugar phosphate nucleotidyltransferase [Candidatus Aenigmatarchaeota archaeon]